MRESRIIHPTDHTIITLLSRENCYRGSYRCTSQHGASASLPGAHMNEASQPSTQAREGRPRSVLIDQVVAATEPAGDPIVTKLVRAPGNDTAIGTLDG